MITPVSLMLHVADLRLRLGQEGFVRYLWARAVFTRGIELLKGAVEAQDVAADLSRPAFAEASPDVWIDWWQPSNPFHREDAKRRDISRQEDSAAAYERARALYAEGMQHIQWAKEGCHGLSV